MGQLFFPEKHFKETRNIICNLTKKQLLLKKVLVFVLKKNAFQNLLVLQTPMFLNQQ